MNKYTPICSTRGITSFAAKQFAFKVQLSGVQNVHKRGMKTVSLQYSEFGVPSSVITLKEEEIKDEVVGTEVLVQMKASPINPADINMIQGVYGIKPSSFPAIGGNEGVGIVIKAGSNSTLTPGDYVIPAKPSFGTWRTNVIAEEKYFTKIPNFISPEFASVLSVNPSTAYRLLNDYSLKPGDTIIQNAANSMVGLAVIQIAKLKGINTINMIRDREENEYAKLVDELKAIGATEVIKEETLFTPQNQTLLSKYPRPSVAFNCVGGKSATDLARFLSDGGTMITYGGMSKQPVTIPTSLLIFKNIRVQGFWLSKWLDDHPVERLKMLEELCCLVRDGKLTFNLEKYALEDYLSALKRSLTERKPHKVVFVMP